MNLQRRRFVTLWSMTGAFALGPASELRECVASYHSLGVLYYTLFILIGFTAALLTARVRERN